MTVKCAYSIARTAGTRLGIARGQANNLQPAFQAGNQNGEVGVEK